MKKFEVQIDYWNGDKRITFTINMDKCTSQKEALIEAMNHLLIEVGVICWDDYRIKAV